MNTEKQRVHDFWNQASRGESLYLQGLDPGAYEAHARKRHQLEPYILEFAGFDDAGGKRILEIGMGLGADHQRFARAGADLHGIDLTARAVEHTRRRLTACGLASQLRVGDAEQLEYPDEYFDRVYSWGALHHSPDTPRAVSEVWRVLKRGGARIMMYHKWGMVGLMLWVRHALLGLRPWLSQGVYNMGYDRNGRAVQGDFLFEPAPLRNGVWSQLNRELGLTPVRQGTAYGAP